MNAYELADHMEDEGYKAAPDMLRQQADRIAELENLNDGLKADVNWLKQRTPILDECEYGHKFAKLENHPMRDGKPRCPHCLAIGFDKYRNRCTCGNAIGHPLVPKCICEDLK
jgi:hypothetical protein